MQKYYTRACNFYFGKHSLQKVKKNLSLPLGGNKSISFDTIEIITRNSKRKLNIKQLKFKNSIKILYGGSVNSKNANEISKIEGIGGLLVGGASLNSKKFVDIIKKTSN